MATRKRAQRKDEEPISSQESSQETPQKRTTRASSRLAQQTPSRATEIPATPSKQDEDNTPQTPKTPGATPRKTRARKTETVLAEIDPIAEESKAKKVPNTPKTKTTETKSIKSESGKSSASSSLSSSEQVVVEETETPRKTAARGKGKVTAASQKKAEAQKKEKEAKEKREREEKEKEEEEERKKALEQQQPSFIAKRQRTVRYTTPQSRPDAITFSGILIDGQSVANSEELAQKVLPNQINVLQDSERLGAPQQGVPVSGRVHKEAEKHRHSALTTKAEQGELRKTWDEKLEFRMLLQSRKMIEKEKWAAKKAQYQAVRKRAEDKKKRQEENEKRSSVYQNITNTQKLRRMNKKQLKNIIKV